MHIHKSNAVYLTEQGRWEEQTNWKVCRNCYASLDYCLSSKMQNAWLEMVAKSLSRSSTSHLSTWSDLKSWKMFRSRSRAINSWNWVAMDSQMSTTKENRFFTVLMVLFHSDLWFARSLEHKTFGRFRAEQKNQLQFSKLTVKITFSRSKFARFSHEKKVLFLNRKSIQKIQLAPSNEADLPVL